MAWYLNPALTRFRNAVNAAYPTRDKASDGTIGDEAHQSTTSDHNPDVDGSVDAWDMDVDLGSRDNGAAIEELKRIFQAHESSRYWIHNRQVASRSDGWVRRPYDGTNPHTMHVHWNTRTLHENSTEPWPIEGDDMTQEEFTQFLNAALGSPAVVTKMRSLAVTYSGGPFPAGYNVLRVLEEIRATVAELGEADPDVDRDAILARIDERAAALTNEVNEVSGEVIADLGAADLTAEQKAELLRPVLGDDAAAVGALLAQV
jgi:hypothetical protein